MPDTLALLLTGSVAGLSIAMPVGPFSLLCIQRALRNGFLAGFSTGLGGATVTVVEATLLLFGLHQLLPSVPGGDKALGVMGGLMLLWSAARTLRARPLRARPLRTRPLRACLLRTEPACMEAVPGYAPAYLSALAFNATNPLTLVLLLAALSPVLGAGVPPALHAAMVVAGMALGLCFWYGCLSLLASLLRARLGARLLRAVNRLAGCVLAAYAAIALAGAFGL